MRRLALAILAALVLASCGKANLAVIPTHPLYVCSDFGHACPNPFDARKLLGLEMPEAEKLAAKHGLTVRPVEIDGRRGPVILDAESNRLDVALRDHIIVKILSKG